MHFKQLFNQETWLPDWDRIFSIDEFKAMENCPQSSVWHQEGNVKNHTKLVTKALIKYLSDRKGIIPSNDEYYIMMVSAAICHDLGKPSTTKFDKEANDYKTANHGHVGAVIARTLFMDEDIDLREKVCYMVRHHMDLHHIFDKPESTNRKMIQLSYGRVTLNDMLILNICDSLGSKNEKETKESIMEKENRIINLANELGCLMKPYHFDSDYDRFKFFVGREEKKNVFKKLIDKLKGQKQFNMYVMIGVPGSGKSYYVDKVLMKDVKVISRDLIRSSLGMVGDKPMGNKEQENKVTEVFNKMVIDCCKNGQDFIIDNTNVRRKYREDYIRMTLEYKPNIIYVYVEAPSLDVNKERRKGMMPLDVIDRMWNQFDFPEPWEYNSMYYCYGSHT